MAARNKARPYTLDRDITTLYGKGTGAAAADLTSVGGIGIASVAYAASTGVYTLTLSDKWAKLLNWHFQVLDATSAAVWAVTVSAETVSSTKTITLNVFKAGTLANLSTDEILKFSLDLCDTAQPLTSR